MWWQTVTAIPCAFFTHLNWRRSKSKETPTPTPTPTPIKVKVKIVLTGADCALKKAINESEDEERWKQLILGHFWSVMAEKHNYKEWSVEGCFGTVWAEPNEEEENDNITDNSCKVPR